VLLTRRHCKKNLLNKLTLLHNQKQLFLLYLSDHRLAKAIFSVLPPLNLLCHTPTCLRFSPHFPPSLDSTTMSEAQLQDDHSSSRWESIRTMMQQTNIKQCREQDHLARMRTQEETKALRKVRHEAKMLSQDQQKSRRRAFHLARMYQQEHRRLPPSVQEWVRSANASASGAVSGSSLSSTSSSPPLSQSSASSKIKKEDSSWAGQSSQA